MVSNFHAESADPKLNFSGIFAKNSLFGWRRLQLTILAEREAPQPKTQWREQLSLVLHGNKTHEQKQLTQKKHLSDHSRFYDQNISTVTLKLKIQNEITEKLF